jgi:biotin carboxyl carrier protein
MGTMRYVVTVENQVFEIDVGRDGRVWVNNRPYDVDFSGLDGRPECSLLVDHRSYEAHIEQAEPDECQMVVAGRPYRARLRHEGRCDLKDDDCPLDSVDIGDVRAPLPGLLVAVPVTVGQRVTSGEVVAVLESMKMNLELCASQSGIVQAVHATPGMDVGQGEVVVKVGSEEQHE